MGAWWIVERTANARFPFRIRVERADGRVLLAVRAQHPWPGAGSQIFCLREPGATDPEEPLEPLERVPVKHLTTVGRKLSVTLDRPQRKRCEFLKVERRYKNQPGTYEQIFFRTEAGVRAHRSSARLELVPTRALHLVVDSAERYPWRFPAARVTRRKLPVGDYALLVEERITAVVERKSLANMLAAVHEIKGLHQQLAELGGCAHAALVVEAEYGDFVKPAKVGRWPPAHLLRVLGELAATHPKVPIVFAGNRRMANVWALRFFAAVAAVEGEPLPLMVREAAAEFGGGTSAPGVDERIRHAVLFGPGGPWSIDGLRRLFPEAPDSRLRRVLNQLRVEGELQRLGRGRAARWHRVSGSPSGRSPNAGISGPDRGTGRLASEARREVE